MKGSCTHANQELPRAKETDRRAVCLEDKVVCRVPKTRGVGASGQFVIQAANLKAPSANALF